MGTNLSSIILKDTISINELKGKTLAVDAFNLLYQFITTIRQYDGSALKDSKGNVTSHLSGLFFRTTKLMKQNIKLVFVFDGVAPELKKKERERRRQVKEEAIIKYDRAVSEGDVELMRKYAGRTAVLTTEMINEAKDLLTYLGLPVIQAPSEGEAQASYMVKKKECYALLSQDTDGMLFGSNKIIRNLSITKRRKTKSAYNTVEPELIDLNKNLTKLKLTQDQLIVVAILCGTDFNIGGIKGVGPKNAIKYVQKYGSNFDKLFEELKWSEYFDYDWKQVFDTITKIKVIDDYELKWSSINKEKLIKLLVTEHEFSKERVENSINELVEAGKQKGLGDFF